MGFHGLNHNSPWVFAFGLLGNIISFLVYIAPVPTFWRILKKKSTEGFQSLPYLSALFSAMLWIYYALLKKNSAYLITINTLGCVIETLYIIIYLIYAPRRARNLSFMLLLILNVGALCLIVSLIQYLAPEHSKVKIVGLICDAFAVCVFVAPLSIMRQVIRTKSVEFMPFTLSLFLTLSAVMWFFYGFLQDDLYIAVPNILGFIFGMLQMLLYVIYRSSNMEIFAPEERQIIEDVRLNMMIMGSDTVYPLDPEAQEAKAEEIISNEQTTKEEPADEKE